MTSLVDLSVTDRYRSAADGFARRVAGTTDWDSPTPVAEWRARDVVGHLTSWLPALLAAGSEVRLTPGSSPEEDPAGAWAALDDQLRSLLDDPATEEVVFEHEHIGRLPLPQMIDQYFTSDVVFHTWDLARATGQDDRLDEAFVADALAGMQAQAEMIRASGQFGQQQPVPDDASVQERFLAFIGRDPRWEPPA